MKDVVEPIAVEENTYNTEILCSPISDQQVAPKKTEQFKLDTLNNQSKE